MSLNAGKQVKLGNRNLCLEKKLGEGGFGEVFLVREQDSDELFALKKINASGDDTRSQRQGTKDELKREAKALSNCTKHKHIVTLYDVEIKGAKALILMEYCAGGNLNSRLAKENITEDLKLRWMRELADAIRFLHSKDIVHRDLKPENVLLTSTDLIKLGDFGLAREYTALKQDGVASDRAYISYNMGTCLGTELWMAPEVFDYRYTEKADIFSLGVIFYVIQTLSYEIIEGEKYFVEMVVTAGGSKRGFGAALHLDQNIELPLSKVKPRRRRELIRDMLHCNPRQRPGAEDVYNDVHVQDI